jgi:hypothetical protein
MRAQFDSMRLRSSIFIKRFEADGDESQRLENATLKRASRNT